MKPLRKRPAVQNHTFYKETKICIKLRSLIKHTCITGSSHAEQKPALKSLPSVKEYQILFFTQALEITAERRLQRFCGSENKSPRLGVTLKTVPPPLSSYYTALHSSLRKWLGGWGWPGGGGGGEKADNN